MKKKKIFILFLALISLSIFAYCATSTYAKYKTTGYGNMATNIYEWHFKINNRDIISGSGAAENIVVKFKEGITDSHKLYPGTEGYFEIKLDYSAVNLDFDYIISIQENDIIPDLKISDIKFLDEDGNEITDATSTISGNTITGTISATDTPRFKNIKAYVKWNDDSTNIMDDHTDTQIAYEYGNSGQPIDFHVEINLVQKNS